MALDFTAEEPLAMADGVKVGLFKPLTGLVVVPAFGPTPQGLEASFASFTEGVLADDVAVIVNPAS